MNNIELQLQRGKLLNCGPCSKEGSNLGTMFCFFLNLSNIWAHREFCLS